MHIIYTQSALPAHQPALAACCAEQVPDSYMDTFIHTQRRAQVLPPMSKKERGRQAWRFAEFSSRVFFLLEACVDQRQDIEVVQYVTTDAAAAYQLERELTGCRWSRVHVFMRFRDHTKQDLMYEELEAAYRSRSTGTHWYHLVSGHLIAESGVTTKQLQNLENDFELVYERRGSSSQLHSLPC